MVVIVGKQLSSANIVKCTFDQWQNKKTINSWQTRWVNKTKHKHRPHPFQNACAGVCVVANVVGKKNVCIQSQPIKDFIPFERRWHQKCVVCVCLWVLGICMLYGRPKSQSFDDEKKGKILQTLEDIFLYDFTWTPIASNWLLSVIYRHLLRQLQRRRRRRLCNKMLFVAVSRLFFVVFFSFEHFQLVRRHQLSETFQWYNKKIELI